MTEARVMPDLTEASDRRYQDDDGSRRSGFDTGCRTAAWLHHLRPCDTKPVMPAQAGTHYKRSHDCFKYRITMDPGSEAGMTRSGTCYDGVLGFRPPFCVLEINRFRKD
jgi:hypothetical protein